MMVLAATPATPVGQTFLFWRVAIPSDYLESSTHYTSPKIPYDGLGDSWDQSIQSNDPLQLDLVMFTTNIVMFPTQPKELPLSQSETAGNTILDAVEDHAGTTWNYNSLTGCIA